MLLTQKIQCPYCGETYESVIDISAGSQELIEDCYACCRPITLKTIVGLDGELQLIEIHREDS
ncbi:MAG: CPXCG motif-containing cysteine-rich protein [Gammaproteobacteria bacterium]|nr:CPXCG motif-containing cysteine-rich protein [Gammaproteobacteria bacterium]